ncbi:MAG TPA: hypothetical protein PKY70_08485 [Nakamurella multipartita]|nr:hypothetical protein [Nakamurella multipartita]
MTTSGWMEDDEALVAQLRQALAQATDRTPEPGGPGLDPDTVERMYAAARAAFTWRTIDQELELLAIAEESAGASVLVRGAEEPVTRTLEFAGRSVSIELEIGPEIIVGQIYPLQAGRLTLLTPAGEESDVTADDVGCFTFPRPPGGPFRLRCTTADAGVITDWICMT